MPLKDLQILLEKLKSPIKVTELNKEYALEFQTKLKALKYNPGIIDGAIGPKTLEAWALYKTKQLFQNQSELIGSSSLELFLADYDETVGVDHSYDKDEQYRDLRSVKVLDPVILGSKTGKTMKMPSGIVRYENELVLPDKKIPLTYGELTKGGVRVPTTITTERNFYKLALQFGKVRDKAGAHLVINSAYRRPLDQAGNAKAAKNSRHLTGEALDITSNTISLSKLYEIVKGTMESGAIGDGKKYGFVHFDVRESSDVIFFGYK
jgi:hypothetical protein